MNGTLHGGGTGDLRVRELHTLAPYLVVQNQDVLVYEGTLWEAGGR